MGIPQNGLPSASEELGGQLASPPKPPTQSNPANLTRPPPSHHLHLNGPSFDDAAPCFLQQERLVYVQTHGYLAKRWTQAWPCKYRTALSLMDALTRLPSQQTRPFPPVKETSSTSKPSLRTKCPLTPLPQPPFSFHADQPRCHSALDGH